MPSHRLVEFKELFDLPALRVLLGKGLDLRAQDGAQESLILQVLLVEAAALDQFLVKGLGIVLEVVRLGVRGLTRPAWSKVGVGDLAPAFQTLGVGGQGTEQVEASLLPQGMEEFLAVMFFIG